MAVRQPYEDDNSRTSRKRSRLMIDISPELRRRIKMAAAQKDLSVYEYVGEILEKAVPSEASLVERRHGLNPEAVEDLLRTRDEIMRRHPNETYDSVETLHQVREERDKELEQTISAGTSALQQERTPMTREALEKLLELREQFKKNHPGQVLDDSTEIIRQMREERSQYLADL